MAPYGGFDHNARALRIVTKLERRYAFDGLNLTWETLEGLVKHNGPLCKPMAGGRAFCERGLPRRS
jgi:dGTPase